MINLEGLRAQESLACKIKGCKALKCQESGVAGENRNDYDIDIYLVILFGKIFVFVLTCCSIYIKMEV